MRPSHSPLVCCCALVFVSSAFVMNGVTPAPLLSDAQPAAHAAEPPPLTVPALVVKAAAPAPKPTPPPDPNGGKYPPGYNFALAAHGAKASGGTRPELLIDGSTTEYDSHAGFAYTIWNASTPAALTVELKDPVKLNLIRLLLWDLENGRFYRYKLEVSPDATGTAWTMIADATAKTCECVSWQELRFEPQTIKRIRVTGTFNSSNSQFHAVELQAYAEPPGGLPKRVQVKNHVAFDEAEF